MDNEYKIETLPNEDLRIVAQQCGIETALKLLYNCPGMTIHIPPVDSNCARPEDLMGMWNDYALTAGLPRANKMTTSRRRNCAARLKELGLADWQNVFKKIIENPYLTGKGKDGWQATFDWIIKNDNNAQKVLDGYYDRKKAGHTKEYSYDRYR
ncbi:MAG: hypothetical protein HQK97_04460 [Nitrospirae bacterium]|nr:hypothetical protein [Nitrospirota bacterium]